jgi:DNA-binding IclR family transcriptional regulator
MRGAVSAPTTRVLNVIEFLSRPGTAGTRFSDLVRELDLTQATAHAILKTLVDRGWVVRDQADKSFSLGPVFAALAGRTGHTLSGRAAAAAGRLAHELEMPTSVLERVGDLLIITASERPDPSMPMAVVGDRIPYAPPFGITYAAWDTAEEQRAWIQRGAAHDADLALRLAGVLEQTRERGYEIDWMTPAMAQAALAIGTLSADAIPGHVRQMIDHLSVEFTTLGKALVDSPLTSSATIASMSAPVLDDEQHTSLIIAIHPLGRLTKRQIGYAATRLQREIDLIRG